MPSQAMQGAMDALGDRQKASASKAPPTLAERRAASPLGTAFTWCLTTCW